jgi:hypothetical protein
MGLSGGEQAEGIQVGHGEGAGAGADQALFA